MDRRQKIFSPASKTTVVTFVAFIWFLPNMLLLSLALMYFLLMRGKVENSKCKVFFCFKFQLLSPEIINRIPSVLVMYHLRFSPVKARLFILHLKTTFQMLRSRKISSRPCCLNMPFSCELKRIFAICSWHEWIDREWKCKFIRTQALQQGNLVNTKKERHFRKMGKNNDMPRYKPGTRQ